MSEELEEYIVELNEVMQLLFKEQFQLSDIDLTSKTAFDWTKAGIHLRERKSKYRRKYNGVEYVWLRLVKELRDFGLPIQSIVNLKAQLLREIDIKEVFIEPLELSDQELKEVDSKIELLSESLLNTVLSSLIMNTVVLQSEIHLLITKKGNCLVQEASPTADSFISELLNEPYITFPLNFIVSDFVGRESLYGLRSLREYVDITEKEKHVLDLLRDGDITSLTVKKNGDEIKLIESEEELDVKDAKGKLLDLMRSGYEDISYKIQNGKIVRLTRKTRHK